MRESKFKSDFKDEVKKRFPNVKQYEPKTHRRKSPDLILLGPGAWATLEFKKEENADQQPNQDLETEELDLMGYARIVDPTMKEEVLNDLERLFTS